MAGHSFAAVSLAVGYGGRTSAFAFRTLLRRRFSPKMRSMTLGGQRFHTCPSTLLQERHDLLLDDVLEVRRPSVGLEGVLARVALVEQERPGIVDLLVDREFEAARLGTAGLRVLPQQSCNRRVVPLAHHISCDDD